MSVVTHVWDWWYRDEHRASPWHPPTVKHESSCKRKLESAFDNLVSNPSGCLQGFLLLLFCFLLFLFWFFNSENFGYVYNGFCYLPLQLLSTPNTFRLYIHSLSLIPESGDAHSVHQCHACFSFKYFIYCMREACVHMEIREDFMESLLYFHLHMGSGEGTQYLYLVNHLIDTTTL